MNFKNNKTVAGNSSFDFHVKHKTHVLTTSHFDFDGLEYCIQKKATCVN